jgi:Gram-negative bacterial TonB protein C-terminal
MRETDKRLRFTDVIVAVVLAAIAGACNTSSPPSTSSTNAGASSLSTLVSDAAKEALDATDSLLSRFGLARASADDTAKPTPVTPPMPTRRPRRNRTAVVAPAPVPEPPDASASPLEVNAPAAIEPVAEPIAVELPPPVDPSVVYSQTDENIEPPRLLSRPLPRRLPSGGSDAATVEVVISPDGGVERVRLTSKPRRLVDVMELSAAKAWQFDPALKDGQPVRYRFELGTSAPPSK